MKKRTFVALVLVLVSGLLACIAGTRPAQKTFTEEEVSEVRSLLKGLNPTDYRIVLPKFGDGKIVGSETYGRLPVTQVQRIASMSNVDFDEKGNLQLIFRACNGGGAGSHTESQTPGTDLGNRIEKVVENIGKSEYILLY